MKKGKIYLVGAGPAGQDLITLRGYKILKQADVVIYDYLVDKKLLEEAREGAELICCDKLAKKGSYVDGFAIHQEKINNLLVKKAKEGRQVVRLKNGDPSIFSRLSQELDSLVRNRIEFEIVPGVTAASAAACFSGVPLTDRRYSSSVALVTGHEDYLKRKSALDWDKISGCQTLVLYMAVENISKIAERLIQGGRSKETPVIAVSCAGRIDQRTVRTKLGTVATAIRKEKISSPAIFIIGKVAGFEKRFNWLKKNRRILFTGLSEERFFLKGTYFHLPLIKIEPLADYRKFDDCLRRIRRFDWIIFTSRYSVLYFFRRIKALGLDARALHGIKVAAIGESSFGKLAELAVKADLVPKNESSKGLLASFKKIKIKYKRIFLPHSDISDKGLTKGLEKLGAEVTDCIAYKNVMPKNLPDLDLGLFDEIIFTSPSGVRNFIKRYGRPPERKIIKCIGEVTRQQLKRI